MLAFVLLEDAFDFFDWLFKLIYYRSNEEELGQEMFWITAQEELMI